MALIAPAVAIIAADEARKMLGDSAQQFGDGGPEYIRSGQPASIVGKVGQAMARGACRRYAEDSSGLDPSAAARYEKACRPYLDEIGYGQPPGIAKPIEGGQCPGARYQIFAEITSPNGTVFSNNGAFVGLGPLGSPSFREEPAGRYGIWMVTGGTASALGAPCGNRTSTTTQERLIWSVSSGADLDFTGRVVNIVPCPNDVPNDCGDLPPEVIDPVPPETPTPNPEPVNPGPEINIDVGVTINVDGSINVDIGTGPIVINPFGGGGGGDGGGGGTDPDTSPPNPEPGPTNPGGNGGFGGDDEFGEPPAGRRWVGCCLTITNRPDTSGVIVGSQPEDVYPSVVGNVRLVFNASGNRQTDTPVRINAKKVCVWEPVQKLNPTGINVDLLPGYGYTYTPYSVPSGD